MPILDVTIVGDADDGLAQRLADAAGRALETEPGRTWVRLHRLARRDYAENGGASAEPLFAHVLLARPPDDRAAMARALAGALARAAGRPEENVHVLFEPAAAGRVAFGGALVPGPEADRASSGARWEAIVGYSRAVRVGDHVWVTGTTSFGEEGEPVGEGDAYTQARQALANVERALARLGAGTQHVVRTRMFVTDITRDWEAVGRAHAEVFAHVRPATTMVEVPRLIEPWMRVEIEADALVTAIRGGTVSEGA
ncbi:MAG: RidA family protein [Sandaracinaceae bacterium]|nr:RidA family protein [Sandaracinaceae bacterium]